MERVAPARTGEGENRKRGCRQNSLEARPVLERALRIQPGGSAVGVLIPWGSDTGEEVKESCQLC